MSTIRGFRGRAGYNTCEGYGIRLSVSFCTMPEDRLLKSQETDVADG